MKQIIRKVIDRKGIVQIVEVPTPHCDENQVLVATHYSLISSGTELATLEKNPIEMVKQTLKDPWMRNAVKNLILGGSIRQTIDTVLNELNLYRIIGYSGTGEVLAVGKNVEEIKIGDKVAFAACGHAEQVVPYQNHIVKLPSNMDLKQAAFVTVGAIALQGVRRAKIQIGDWVVVYGLGLIGQLTTQILLAAGAKVIGIDYNDKKIELAKNLGVHYIINPKTEEIVNGVLRITNNKGADSTIICAVSSEPIIANNAMKMTRKQGKVVFVGIVKMELERMPFFLNELDLSFSRAYGPGSYDNNYEKGRIDYPYHYIRWTEKRNLEEIIRLIAEKKIKIAPLIETIYPLQEAQSAFNKIESGEMSKVTMLLSYPVVKEITTKILVKPLKVSKIEKDIINVGIIGVGNFTRNIHLPNLHRLKGYHIRTLCSASGVNASSMAEKYKVDYMTTDYHEILNDKEIDLVLIATRHNLHAQIAIESANAGKHIFLEKPVAMRMEEWEAVKDAISESDVHFMVGYNRRYSSLSRKAKQYITHYPIMVRYTVNIQNLPLSHWTLDPIEGGGRLIGEAEHFFDLMNYFTNSKPIEVQACSFPITEDKKEGLFNFMVQVKYENNSIGHLIYTSLGGPKYPRETVELFCGSNYISIIGFKELFINKKTKIKKSDLGHFNELKYFYNCFLDKEEENKLEILQASWICLKAEEIINNGK